MKLRARPRVQPARWIGNERERLDTSADGRWRSRLQRWITLWCNPLTARVSKFQRERKAGEGCDDGRGKGEKGPELAFDIHNEATKSCCRTKGSRSDAGKLGCKRAQAA